DEANKLIPKLRIELKSLQRIKREIDVKMTVLQQMRAGEWMGDVPGDPDPYFQLECEIEFAQMEARTHVINIHKTGAELKDIERGLIDFPAWKDGVEVLL